jgi:hypothetical protein
MRRYCEDLGGFLAEPISPEDHAFLSGHARQFDNVNWWIGLRGSEDCTCNAPIAGR